MNTEMKMTMSSPTSMQMMNMTVMQDCIDACSAAMQACTMCSDQVAGEEGMGMCASLCATCSDVCMTAMRMMMRPMSMHPDMMMRMMQTCMAACKACMEECMKHADMSESCRMCADACRVCMDACQRVMDLLMA